MASSLSRRDLVERCLRHGSAFLAPVSSARSRGGRSSPTKPRDAVHAAAELGPFYKRKAPKTAILAPEGAPGVPLTVEGVVLDTRGERLEGAVLELWHASSAGLYDNEGYLYRGVVEAGSKGAYEFRSVLPGPLRRARLPARPLPGDGTRPQAARHPALLRDRPRLRRRPGPELPQGSAHHEPRARAARLPRGRRRDRARARALRDLPGTRLMGRPPDHAFRLERKRRARVPVSRSATLSRRRSRTGRCASTGLTATCAGPGRPAIRGSSPFRSRGTGGGSSGAGPTAASLWRSRARGASSARSPRTRRRSKRSPFRATGASSRRPQGPRPPRSGPRTELASSRSPRPSRR